MDAATIEKRDKIVEQYIGLASRIANRWASGKGPEVSSDDLLGPANLGLVKAANDWDEERCDDFQKYASLRIVHEIMDYFRTDDHLSRGDRELLREYKSLDGTLEERAKQMGCDADKLARLMTIPKQILDDFADNDKLEAKRLDNGYGDKEAVPYEAGAEENYDELENIVNICCRLLKPKTAACFRLRHLNGYNNKEIAEQLGMGTTTVWVLINKAYKFLGTHSQLRNMLGLEPGETMVSE